MIVINTCPFSKQHSFSFYCFEYLLAPTKVSIWTVKSQLKCLGVIALIIIVSAIAKNTIKIIQTIFLYLKIREKLTRQIYKGYSYKSKPVMNETSVMKA